MKDNAVAEALLDRLAQADKPARELLEEVWEAIHGARPNDDTPEDEMWAWYRKFRPFNNMLGAEAWTSAVEMLTGKESTALADAIACLKARGLTC